MYGIGKSGKADLFISNLSDEMASTVLERESQYTNHIKREKSK